MVLFVFIIGVIVFIIVIIIIILIIISIFLIIIPTNEQPILQHHNRLQQKRIIHHLKLQILL